MGDPVYRILGPLEVESGGREVVLTGEKLRLLLGVLVLSAGRRVADERLVDLLWPSSPPPTARESLRVHVSRLRKALGDGAVLREAGGYVLVGDGAEVDAITFESLVAEARALREDDAERAAATYRAAEALWRGPVAAELPFDQVPPEAQELEELRLVATEERVDVELALGRGPELVPELRALVSTHLLRERLRGQLMLALYAGGRQTDALAAYREAREQLTSELGIEPGPELRRIERGILEHDPGLPGAAAARTRRRRRRRVRIGGPILAATLVAVVALAATAYSDDTRPRLTAADVVPDSLVELDSATGTVRSVTPLPEGPDAIAVTRDALWVTSVVARTVSRVDRRTHEVEVVGGVPAAGDVAASEAGEVWVGNLRARAVTLVNERGADFRDPRPRVAVPGGAIALDAAGDVLWVTVAEGDQGPGGVARIDLRRREVLGTTKLGTFPASVAVSRGEAWVADYKAGTVTPVGAGGRPRGAVAAGEGPITVAADEDEVWVGLFWANEVVRIDPVRRAVVARVPVGEGLGGMALGGGSVWVANRDSSSLTRIDGRTNRVRATISLAAPPYGVAYDGGRLWVTTQRCGSPNVECAAGSR